jgi:hypothetical protein
MNPKTFQFVETADGSPSLRLCGPEGLGEPMHNLKGAFSETLYIYGPALRAVYSQIRQPATMPRVMSVGLGLGYIEILAAVLYSKSSNAKSAGWSGESFELSKELRENFASWILDEGVPDGFRTAYNKILNLTCEHEKVDPKKILNLLRQSLRDGNWKIRQELSEFTKFDQKFNCICYDAFSSRTSPALWEDIFLSTLLDSAAAPSALVATYACVSGLKHALSSNNFALEIRKGFAGKRNCSMASRGIFVLSQNET